MINLAINTSLFKIIYNRNNYKFIKINFHYDSISLLIVYVLNFGAKTIINITIINIIRKDNTPHTINLFLRILFPMFLIKI
jgi:hypothetical protein